MTMPLTFSDSFISAAMSRGFSKSAAAQLLRVHAALERAESDTNFRTSFETKLAQGYTDNVMGRLGNAVGQGVGKAKSLFGALKVPFAAPTANYSTPGTYAQPSAPTGWEPPAQLDPPDNLPVTNAPAAPAADKGLMQPPTPPAAPPRADINAGAVAGPAAATQTTPQRMGIKQPATPAPATSFQAPLPPVPTMPASIQAPAPAAVAPTLRPPAAPTAPAPMQVPPPPDAVQVRDQRLAGNERFWAAKQENQQRAAQLAQATQQRAQQAQAAIESRGTGIFRRNPETGMSEEIPVGNGYTGRGRGLTPEERAAVTNSPGIDRLVAGQVYIPGRGVVDSVGGQARRDQLRTDAIANMALPAEAYGGMDNAQRAHKIMLDETGRLEYAKGTPVYDPTAPTAADRARLAEQALARERAGRFAASASGAGAHAPRQQQTQPRPAWASMQGPRPV